ncbi:hypothetical protein RQP46_011310 [Phenoliferia psychrophenolica]
MISASSCSKSPTTAPCVTSCLKFKTHSSVFLNRFELLTRTLIAKMQNRRPPPVVVAPVELPKAVAAAAAAGVGDEVGAPGAGDAAAVKDDGKAKKKPKPKKKK